MSDVAAPARGAGREGDADDLMFGSFDFRVWEAEKGL